MYVNCRVYTDIYLFIKVITVQKVPSMSRFIDRFNGMRTPFNLILDPTWAANEDLRDGTIQFLQYIRANFRVRVTTLQAL